VIYDFVVIGAGVSGMTAAAILAKNGFHVALVEKSSKTAPLIRGFVRQGMTFETGFHYIGGLGKGEVLDTLFNYLGLRERLETIAFDPDGFDRARCLTPAFEFDFPYGYERIQDRLEAEFPREKPAVEKFLRDVREAFLSFPYTRFSPELLYAGFAKGWQGITLRDYLDRLTADSRLKWVLALHCLLHGVPAAEVAFDYHATVVAAMFSSVHTVKGGGVRLSQVFDDRLEKLGVEVLCGQGISRLEFSAERKVSAVQLADGRRLACQGVVSTVHPRRLLELLPEGILRPAYCRRLAQLEETLSAFMIFGSCRGIESSAGPRHMIGAPDLEIGGFGEEKPVGERMVFLSIEPPESPVVGLHKFSALCPAAPQETDRWTGTTQATRPADYHEFKKRVAEKLLRQIEGYWPELEGQLFVLEAATPLTFRDRCHTPTGSLFGVKHRIDQYAPLPATRAGGLWLAGQATVAPGIMGAMISAYLACGFILGHERILTELRECRCAASS
jgi:all-trans-retinol 13,14-reductase